MVGGGALRRVGKYEVGRTIGEGTFAKVKFAQNTESGESVAMKVVDRSSILKHKMADQIKREISIMKLVRHPNVVRLHEVLASRKKIFIILEFITGGELFDKIIRHGRLNEADARRYFQQLIDGVDFCHSKGVYHRDLKPENLLLDSQGNLKISDFGLSAWPAQGGALLRTTCGTPNYVAPESVFPSSSLTPSLFPSLSPLPSRPPAPRWPGTAPPPSSSSPAQGSAAQGSAVLVHEDEAGLWFPFADSLEKDIFSDLFYEAPVAAAATAAAAGLGADGDSDGEGKPCKDDAAMAEERGGPGYDGALADTWSCGVILYVLLAGYLPFDEVDLTTLYGKIESAEYSFPAWFPNGAKSLIHRILDPNPDKRIRIEEIRNDEWFKKNYEPTREIESEEVNLDDVNAAFDDPEEDADHTLDDEAGPLTLNAFDLIILSQGLNLAALFDRRQDYDKLQNRFLSRKPAKVIMSSMEVVAQSMGYKTHIRNYKMRVEGLNANKTSHLTVMLEIFEVAPSIFMIELQRAAGDTSDYNKFINNYCSKLDDIIWNFPIEKSKSRISRLSKR
uniref:non-specific serine/threonine protein kinase n=1 Tax=Oryza rufipogon TaxID=4529 RepID=A0A0E0MXL4_ORYRU